MTFIVDRLEKMDGFFTKYFFPKRYKSDVCEFFNQLSPLLDIILLAFLLFACIKDPNFLSMNFISLICSLFCSLLYASPIFLFKELVFKLADILVLKHGNRKGLWLFLFYYVFVGVVIKVVSEVLEYVC